MINDWPRLLWYTFEAQARGVDERAAYALIVTIGLPYDQETFAAAWRDSLMVHERQGSLGFKAKAS